MLLVARGFVAATAAETRPADPGATGRPRDGDRPAAPGQTATTSARACPGTARSPRSTRARRPRAWARRCTRPTLPCAPPAGHGRSARAAAPSLSNPSGGAGELQLLSYVVQWYVFALLALLGPFALARAEVRDARRRFLGIDDDAGVRPAAAPRPRSALAGPAAPGGDSPSPAAPVSRGRRTATLQFGARSASPTATAARWARRGTGRRRAAPARRVEPARRAARQRGRRTAAPTLPRQLQRLPLAAGAGRRQHPRRRAADRHPVPTPPVIDHHRRRAHGQSRPSRRPIRGMPRTERGCPRATPPVPRRVRPGLAGCGRLAQRESTRFTPERSLVRSQ